MNIREPMTMATDYLLAAAAVWFAIRLWRLERVRAWPLAFLFTAAGSLTGGTYHAIGGEWLWKATVYSIGLASFFLLVAMRVPVIVALGKFLVYATWMITHDGFEFVIADYGLTLLIIAVIAIVAWFRSRATGAPWIIGSVALSIAAAVAQQSGDLAPHFNHNDLYHVIQLAALWLLYRGARR